MARGPGRAPRPRPGSRTGRNMSRHDRLMIFGRFPEAGRAKTRLAPALGPQAAADLYRAFLADTVSSARRLPEVHLEFWVETHPAAAHWIAGQYADLTLRWQADGGLGDRLRSAFESAFADGVSRAVALGSDHPTLPHVYLRQAFEALHDNDVVVGPTEDGGYYAIGIRRGGWSAAVEVFDDMPWSSPDLMPQTRARLAQLGIRVSELPSWYDVDRPKDLERLRGDVMSGSRTARVLQRISPGGAGSPTTD